MISENFEFWIFILLFGYRLYENTRLRPGLQLEKKPLSAEITHSYLNPQLWLQIITCLKTEYEM